MVVVKAGGGTGMSFADFHSVDVPSLDPENGPLRCKCYPHESCFTGKQREAARNSLFEWGIRRGFHRVGRGGLSVYTLHGVMR